MPDFLGLDSSSPLLSSRTIQPSTVLGGGLGLDIGMPGMKGGILANGLKFDEGNCFIISECNSGVRTGTGKGIRCIGASGGGLVGRDDDDEDDNDDRGG